VPELAIDIGLIIITGLMACMGKPGFRHQLRIGISLDFLLNSPLII